MEQLEKNMGFDLTSSKLSIKDGGINQVLKLWQALANHIKNGSKATINEAQFIKRLMLGNTYSENISAHVR